MKLELLIVAALAAGCAAVAAPQEGPAGLAEAGPYSILLFANGDDAVRAMAAEGFALVGSDAEDPGRNAMTLRAAALGARRVVLVTLAATPMRDEPAPRYQPLKTGSGLAAPIAFKAQSLAAVDDRSTAAAPRGGQAVLYFASRGEADGARPFP